MFVKRVERNFKILVGDLFSQMGVTATSTAVQYFLSRNVHKVVVIALAAV